MSIMQSIPVRSIPDDLKESCYTGGFSVRRLDELMVEGEPMVQPVHRHDFFFPLLISSGEGEHIIDFKSYEIADKQLFVLHPGQVHSICIEPGSKGYLVEIAKDFTQSYLSVDFRDNLGTGHLYSLKGATFDRIQGLFELMSVEFEEQSKGVLEAIASCLRLLSIQLSRCNTFQLTEENSSAHYAFKVLKRFQVLLEENFKTKKQVQDYAALMHMSAYQLNRVVKTTLNKTCSQVIREYLLLEARRQLLATPAQVSEIADYLGYEDVSYFNRFFKKQLGETPLQYRKNFK